MSGEADRGRWALPRGVECALSVDVEDYFQVGLFESKVSREEWPQFEPRVEANTRRLLALLERTGSRATFFVLGWIAERHPELVREIAAAGHELATHGYDHRDVTTMAPSQFRHDLRRAKSIVEDIADVQVIGYRAPNYSIVAETTWALDILFEEGFKYDSSIFPIVHDRYGVPGAPRFPWRPVEHGGEFLVEFPISTVRLLGINLPFVGGGYLRQFPWFFIRWGMRRVTEGEHRPVVVYVHPWEVDPDQPRLPVSALARVRHYRNLDKTEQRLEALCREFRFTTVRQVLAPMLGGVAGKEAPWDWNFSKEAYDAV